MKKTLGTFAFLAALTLALAAIFTVQPFAWWQWALAALLFFLTGAACHGTPEYTKDEAGPLTEAEAHPRNENE